MPAMRHVLPITAHADDIDELGHISNVVYVRWVLEVALSHSNAIGWDTDRWKALGAIVVVRRHEIDYLVPVLEGERIDLETWVDGWRAASLIRHTSMRRASDGVVMARAATTWAYIDTTTGRPRRIPEEVKIAFGGGEEPAKQ